MYAETCLFLFSLAVAPPYGSHCTARIGLMKLRTKSTALKADSTAYLAFAETRIFLKPLIA